MGIIKYTTDDNNNNNYTLSKFDKYILTIYIPILFYRQPNKNHVLDEIFYILTLYLHIKGYMTFVNKLVKIYSINNKKIYSITDSTNTIDPIELNVFFLIQTKNVEELNKLNINYKELFNYEYKYYISIT